MIIIPIKWLYHWEYTLFSDKPKCCCWEGVCDWGARNCDVHRFKLYGTQSHARGELVETNLVTKQRVAAKVGFEMSLIPVLSIQRTQQSL